MLKMAPSVLCGSPNTEAVTVWLGLAFQVSLAANESVVILVGITVPTPGVPGAEIGWITVEEFVWLIRL
jgi:hypothetical protein